MSGDTVACDASNGKFAAKDAGSQAVTADVALNGGDDGNYQLTSPSAATTAMINQRNVTASITAADKTYDGSRDAAISSCTLEAATGNHGVVSGDAVGCSASDGKFATRNAGSQVVSADVALSGSDDGNYQLTSASAATTATINQRNVTASISAMDKTYDSTRNERPPAARWKPRLATTAWCRATRLAVTPRMGSSRPGTRVTRRSVQTWR